MNTASSVLGPDTGIILCGHGSRAAIAETEFAPLASALQARYPQAKVAYGFLEYSAPNIHMALDSLREQGVKRIYALPGMLFAANHAKNDIPSVLLSYAQAHPELQIDYGQELGLHPAMIKAFQSRILSALPAQTESENLYDSMLIVVGRGTSVVEANAEVAKLCRIVSENLGFGWAETVYSGVTYPSVGRGLEMALKLGYKKIVVAPYFLFGGRLINRIYAYTDKIAKENPQVAFHKADYLRDQDFVIDTLVCRLEELIQPTHSAPGLMADFQRRLDQGQVEIHHHHAEFKQDEPHQTTQENTQESTLKNTQNQNQEQHSHQHAHTHHHAPYRHIAHPHGPRTMINEQVCCCFMSQFPQAIIDEEQHKPLASGQPACSLENQ